MNINEEITQKALKKKQNYWVWGVCVILRNYTYWIFWIVIKIINLYLNIKVWEIKESKKVVKIMIWKHQKEASIMTSWVLLIFKAINH